MKNDFRFDDSPDEGLEEFAAGLGQNNQNPPAEGLPNETSEHPPAETSGNSDWDYARFFTESGEDSPEPDIPATPPALPVTPPKTESTVAPIPQRKGSKKRKNRSGCLKSIIWIAIIGVVSIGLAMGVIGAARDILAIGKSDTIVSVEIKPGMSTVQIAEELEEQGIIDMPLLFRLYTKFMKYDGTFRYGVYHFSPDSGYEAIAESLKKEGKQAESVTLTVPEGVTVDNLFALIEEKGICSVRHLRNAMNSETFDHEILKSIPKEKVRYFFEGYLCPETYDFFPNDSLAGAKAVLSTMIQQLDKNITAADYAEAARRKFTMHEIMTMASIVEMEASGMKEEMPKVAAVFFNRLAWTEHPNRLDSDPTKKYPDKRYNTYENPGLPPGPLCSPSLNAVKAALYPEKSFGYDYFVTDKSMKFYYSKTLSEHQKIVNQLIADKNIIGW